MVGDLRLQLGYSPRIIGSCHSGHHICDARRCTSGDELTPHVWGVHHTRFSGTCNTVPTMRHCATIHLRATM